MTGFANDILGDVLGNDDQADAADRAARTQADAVMRGQDLFQENLEAGTEIAKRLFRGSADNLRFGAEAQINNISRGETRAMDELNSGEQGTKEQIEKTLGESLQALRSGYAEAEQPLQGYSQRGDQASEMQAALSGALGEDAQRTAIEQFKSSGLMDFYQDEQERAIQRGAAARQNLLSPKTLTALQDRAFKQSQSDYDNYANRLGEISDRGMGAGSMLASLRERLTGNTQGAIERSGTTLADIIRMFSGDRAGLKRDTNREIGAIRGSVNKDVAQTKQNLGQLLLNANIGAGTTLAQLAQNYGTANAQGDAFRAGQPTGMQQALQFGSNAIAALA